jgi:hypothetical protein
MFSDAYGSAVHRLGLLAVTFRHQGVSGVQR